MFWRKKEQPLVVLLATRNDEAIRVANERLQGSRFTEAFSTARAMEGIRGANLIVIDPEQLFETPGAPADMLVATLRQSGAVVVSGPAFLADPLRHVANARMSVGDLHVVPPHSIANVNYAGGVGKTTLAIETAVHFAERTKLPVVVIELSQGASAFHALIDPKLPDFYAVMTQGAALPTWRGVTLVPMVYSTARRLVEGSLARTLEFVSRLRRQHVLTVFDVVAGHALWPDVRPLVDTVFLIVAPKADSVLQAEAAREDLREMGNGKGPGDVRVIANMISPTDLLSRVVLAGVERSLTLPRVPHPDRFDGKLGRSILPLVYEGWRP